VPATPPDLHSFQQPSLAANPDRSGELAIAYQDGGQLQSCGLSLSTDGGRAWRARDLIGGEGRFALPGGESLCWNPVVAYGSPGVLYYAFQASTSEFDSRILTVVSDDGGRTFEPPRAVASAGESLPGGGDWYPRIAVDPGSGRVYVAWIRFGPPPHFEAVLLIASSTDLGRTFTRPTPVPTSAQGAPPGALESLAVAAGPQGRVSVAWMDVTEWRESCLHARADCNSPGRLEVATSSDGAVRFTPARTVAGAVSLGCASMSRPHCDAEHGSGLSGLESMAAGPSGNLFTAWFQPVGGHNRVRFSSSPDGGRSWTPARTVAPAGSSGDDQFRPVVSVAPGGRVDLAFYDRTPTGMQDVYWTWSTDGGESFTPPIRVTDRPSDGAVGPPDLFFGDAARVSFGDRLGMTSQEGSAVIAWTDSRRGDPDNAKQDIYVARASISRGTRHGLLFALVVGGGAIGLGAAALVLRRRRRRLAISTGGAGPQAG
jgi:hypothetical protein